MGERLGDTALWVVVRDAAYTTLRNRGWSHDEADDGAQDTVLQLQDVLAKGVVLDEPAAWANTVAFRKSVDRHRRARLAGARPQGDVGDDDHREAGGAEVDLVGSLSRFLADGQPTSRQAMQRQQVERFIDALSERELHMAWLTAEGLTQEEIGEAFGISAEGVKKAMQRMRRSLRARADELGIDVEVLDHPRVY
jgi:RNA polymerase sigma factor (sigma-70 family)